MSYKSKVRLFFVLCLWLIALSTTGATPASADIYKPTLLSNNPVGNSRLDESSSNGTVAADPAFSNFAGSNSSVKFGVSGSPRSSNSKTASREDNSFMGFADDQALSVLEAAKSDSNKPKKIK